MPTWRAQRPCRRHAALQAVVWCAPVHEAPFCAAPAGGSGGFPARPLQSEAGRAGRALTSPQHRPESAGSTIIIWRGSGLSGLAGAVKPIGLGIHHQTPARDRDCYGVTVTQSGRTRGWTKSLTAQTASLLLDHAAPPAPVVLATTCGSKSAGGSVRVGREVRIQLEARATARGSRRGGKASRWISTKTNGS